jgi:DNA-binding transcriptional MerR regulator
MQGARVSDHDVVDIAELGRRTGTAPSALRYYERLGLLAPTGRVGGRRQYVASAAERVAMIRLCQDAGFTLAEIHQLLRVNFGRKTAWARQARQKVDELGHRIAEAQRAKALLEHGLNCPAPNLLACPHFRHELQARLIDTTETAGRRA